MFPLTLEGIEGGDEGIDALGAARKGAAPAVAVNFSRRSACFEPPARSAAQASIRSAGPEARTPIWRLGGLRRGLSAAPTWPAGESAFSGEASSLQDRPAARPWASLRQSASARLGLGLRDVSALGRRSAFGASTPKAFSCAAARIYSMKFFGQISAALRR